MSLLKKHCEPVEGGDMKVLPKTEAQNYLQETPDWTLHQKSIEREFRFRDFKESMDFIRKVGDVCEQEGHHPDIFIFNGRVKLQLTTHIIGGLSLNDFILAAKIDHLL